MYPWVLDMGKYKSHTGSSSPRCAGRCGRIYPRRFPGRPVRRFPKQGRPPQRKAPRFGTAHAPPCPAPPSSCGRCPSAMGLRQVLPVQTNKIFIDVQTLLLPAGDSKPRRLSSCSPKKGGPLPGRPAMGAAGTPPWRKRHSFLGFPRPRRLGRVSPVSTSIVAHSSAFFVTKL